MSHEDRILEIIWEEITKAGRRDLFRAPMCAFSSAEDERYHELKTIVGPWVKEPRELLPDARTVISFFVPFSKELVAVSLREEPVARAWGEAYVVLNALYDVIGLTTAAYLRGQGFSALPMAATHTYDPVKLESLWSHRSAAAIAGLGSFGVNRMLFTEKGAAGRCSSVLTSAPLNTTKEPAEQRCLHYLGGGCLLCLRACPVQALKLDSLDKFTCHDHLLENQEYLKDIGDCDVCGKCVVNCPVAYIE